MVRKVPVRWLVDGNNVMGSRPDGWWRDRPAAMQRLVSQLEQLGEPVTVIFDGRPQDLDAPSDVTVEFASRAGRDAADDDIARAAGPGITVVTSDADLRRRAQEAGAEVIGARELLGRL
jgi:uncharacterized protein YaiI (UPF0178 family)